MSTSLSHLHERRLEAVRHDADSHQWVFTFTGGLVLQVSSPWRLLAGGCVAVGCEDDGQKFGLAIPVDSAERVRSLAGSGMVQSATYDSAGDLAVQFESGSLLQVFNVSSGYEGWILNGPGKGWVVCQGGGRVVNSETDG